MRLDIEDIEQSFGDLTVLDRVSATIDEGSLVGLVGPNGAGKTTLLRTITGGLTPDAGTVSAGDAAVHDLSSRAASRRIAVVPQETTISFDFTVRDVVEMGRHPHQARFGADPDPDIVAEAMERTEVAQFAERSITAVSGGERKRVLLARALAQDAPILLLDEPTAGLDVNHQIRTLDLVRDLVSEGRTALAAIHDLDLAARYCDRLLVLSDGGVLAYGPPEEVLTTSTLREAFDARTAVSENPVTGSPAVTPLSEQADERPETVHVLGGGGAAAPLVRQLADGGFRVTVGPVVEGDADHRAARALAADCVTVEPFAGVDGDAFDAARALVERADATVVASDALDLGRNRDLLAGRVLVAGDRTAVDAPHAPAERVAAAVHEGEHGRPGAAGASTD
ncbi:heme ABC transporter ATP-binding protein [Salarchaeum sp. III]|uniref:heme ABC transporter ATP-binding protein n=1 Tax=Salarchaeum sp. III TaxID=3107927 RepID=UPI002ED997C5